MKYSGYTANNLYQQGLEYVKRRPAQEGRGEPTKEVTHVMFELMEPRNRLVSMRDINPAFAFVECLWIAAGGNCVKYLEFWNKRMWDFAAKENGLLYGAYGARLGFHHFWDDWDYSTAEPVSAFDPELNKLLYVNAHTMHTSNQPLQAYEALQGKPNSRQVVLQVWDSVLDLPNNMGQERAPDIPCNLLGHLLVRDGMLHWLQVMRSNDAVWGWPYNIIQWTMLQEWIAGWLDVKPGPYVLVSDSWHVYQKHWSHIQPILDRYVNEPQPKFYVTELGMPFQQWKYAMQGMIELAWRFSWCKLGEEIDLVNSTIMNYHVSMQYLGVLGMLAAEAQRIKGNPELACDTADTFQAYDPYWMNAWRRWFLAKQKGEIL